MNLLRVEQDVQKRSGGMQGLARKTRKKVDGELEK
jgi:hypothetical protein